MSATIINLQTGDKDAIAIGRLCARAKGSMADSVKYLIEAGQKLTEKKNSLKHGEWLPWLKENADVLGFRTRRTAAMLMQVGAKWEVNFPFDETQAAQISKQIWGNAKKGEGRTKSKPRARKNTDAQETAAAKMVLDGGKSYKQAAAATGLNGTEQVVKIAVAREQGRREAEVTPAMLSKTAQEKLAMAMRQHKRTLDAEHTTRMRGLDEEVRLRVVADGKEYLAMVKEREAEANKTIALYREFTNNSKPLFTKDQFDVIRMCLHPDGQRTKTMLDEAFRLFNEKKFQLTGKK